MPGGVNEPGGVTAGLLPGADLVRTSDDAPDHGGSDTDVIGIPSRSHLGSLHAVLYLLYLIGVLAFPDGDRDDERRGAHSA